MLHHFFTVEDAASDWGLMIASNDPIPEALTVGIVVMLSSAAVASFYCLCKHPKTGSYSAGKTDKIS